MGNVSLFSQNRLAACSTLIIVVALFLLQPVEADDTATRLKELEARLIYEAASQLVMDEEYDKAIRRFDRIILQYPETKYARLAESKKSEVAILRLQPKPISGTSRASLVGFGTLFTTWLGAGTLILAGAEEPEPYGVALIAGSLSGLAGSLRLTRHIRLSDGQASLINFGGVWGVWQATSAALIADASDKGTVGASMAGGIIGLALAGSIVKGRNIEPGDATMINFGGIWGTWFALCGAMLADLEDGDDILTYSMIGGDIGLFTVAALSSKLKVSRTRARLINIGGIVGTLYGLGTNVLFEIDSKRDFWNILGMGGVLGLAAGSFFTRDYDAEKGYFAERTNVSIITLSYPDGVWKQNPEVRFQIPIAVIRF